MTAAALDRYGCRGNTIKVAGGHYFDLLNPTPEMIDIHSIAAALSKICRFGGHCPRFYSVGEHCVHAMEMANKDGHSKDFLRAILLHDAAEAYIGDMVKPLKLMLPEFSRVERRVEQAIAERFGLVECHNTIKFYDRAMLKAEKIKLWTNDKEEWEGFAGIPEMPVNFFFWRPELAEVGFLAAAERLGLMEEYDA